ncbi:molecular chaperone DnaJ [Chloroflexota bacterium]
MSSKRDYYEVLGLDRDATDEEIKRAFRKMAFQCHPDHNRDDGAEEKFKEVNEAYNVLCDPDKRSAYDRFGHGTAEGIFGKGFEGFNFGGFGDIFDAFFGGTTTTTRQTPRRGSDLQYSTIITFEEAAFGCEKEISISRSENCSICHGIGCKPGTQPSRCPNCNGTGQVRRVQQNIFGSFTNVTTCNQCRGEGRIINEACPQCRGTGREKRQRNIQVRVPAGVDNNSQIRFSGEGESGAKGGSPGDLYISLSVKEHDFFTRDGDDIYLELPVNFAQVAIGSELEVPTIDDKTKLKIPAGSQAGQVFRLKAKGFPHLRGRGRGDQLVILNVVTPDSLTKRQRELFEELADSFGSINITPQNKEKGLLNRLKHVFVA